ncbi:hypothetical protein HY483_03220 [Candidatus Woesearchaeota archaeon]|nr:hypothetical protein [Candidatus Woesearchaeota archaeon]
MDGSKVREELITILGNNVKFNKRFDEFVSKLKEGMAGDLIDWCKRCKENKELGSVPPRKEFKNLYVFFRKIASDVRAVLIKEQNKEFIELILDNHGYYDDARAKLGYKKSSHYGS